MLARILTALRRNPQDIEIPEADNAVDRHINDAAPDIQTGLDMETDDFDMDMKLSSQVESLRDFFADVEGITAGAESATTTEELEASWGHQTPFAQRAQT